MTKKITGDSAIDACKKIMEIKEVCVGRVNSHRETMEYPHTRGQNLMLETIRSIIESHQVDDTEEREFVCSMSPLCPCDDCQKENDCPLPPDRI